MRPDDPRALAAAAMRRLGHALVAHEVDADLLLRVATAAERVADELAEQPPRERDLVALKKRMFEDPFEHGDRVSHFDECFVSGSWNPMGPAIEVHRDGDEIVAEVVLGAAFEGAPGRAHGGIVAAIFDDVMGYVLTLERQPAFTGEMSIRYEAATPMGSLLEFRARMVERAGRKLVVTSEAIDRDGKRVASAHATFIAVDLERIRA